MSLVSYVVIIIILIVVLSLLNDIFSLLLFSAFLYFVTAFSNEIFTDAVGTGIQNWVYVFPLLVGTVGIVKMMHIAGKGKEA